MTDAKDTAQESSRGVARDLAREEILADQLRLEREKIALEREKLLHEREKLAVERERIDALLEQQRRFRKLYVSPVVNLLVAVLFCALGIGFGLRLAGVSGLEPQVVEYGSAIMGQGGNRDEDVARFFEGWTNIAFSAQEMDAVDGSSERKLESLKYFLLFQ